MDMFGSFSTPFASARPTRRLHKYIYLEYIMLHDIYLITCLFIGRCVLFIVLCSPVFFGEGPPGEWLHKIKRRSERRRWNMLNGADGHGRYEGKGSVDAAWRYSVVSLKFFWQKLSVNNPPDHPSTISLAGRLIKDDIILSCAVSEIIFASLHIF